MLERNSRQFNKLKMIKIMESKFVSENTFNNWNTLKEQLDSRKNPPFVNEREICFLCIGKNIG